MKTTKTSKMRPAAKARAVFDAHIMAASNAYCRGDMIAYAREMRAANRADHAYLNARYNAAK
jgi:hypothetical protein